MRKIYEMHRRFGRRGHGKCQDCTHFERHVVGNKTVRKCRVYGATASEATDWTGRWEACGKFNEPYKGPQIIDVLRHAPRRRDPEANEPLDGQMDLFEEGRT